MPNDRPKPYVTLHYAHRVTPYGLDQLIKLFDTADGFAAGMNRTQLRAADRAASGLIRAIKDTRYTTTREED